jgi:iron complex transport system substrate-binding protein
LKIVSLCPSNSEILFAIGAGEQVVAVEKWTDFPPEAARLPKVGTEMDVDMDAVASLEPDLVLASLSVPGMEKNVEALKARGIPHMVLDPRSIADVYGDVLRVGKAVGREEEALSLVRSMESQIAGLKSRNTGRERPVRLYIEWWPKPAISPGGACWTSEMIEVAGGKNIFSDMDAMSGQVSYRDVVDRDPEIILLCWCGIHRREIDPASLRSREGWSRINAVSQERIHVVEEGWYGRPGPRIVEGIEQMAGMIAALGDA